MHAEWCCAVYAERDIFYSSAERHYSEFRYVECRCVECHHPKCHGAR
jgi:hypothetical protein